MKARRREYWRTLRHTVAALFVLFILILISINPWGASSPGIAGPRETYVTASPADESKMPEGVLCYVDVDAPLPYLRCGNPANNFQVLRRVVIDGAGFDFLAKCGDMMRPKNAMSLKIGVTFRSRHKSGEAFDYNQEDQRVLLLREYKAGHIYWRTFLRCEKQDGTVGVKADLYTDNAGFVSAYVFDFTAAAESFGWERIPAQRGWMYEPSNKEFWHYQMRGNLSFNQAMSTIYDDAAACDGRSISNSVSQASTAPRNPLTNQDSAYRTVTSSLEGDKSVQTPERSTARPALSAAKAKTTSTSLATAEVMPENELILRKVKDLPKNSSKMIAVVMRIEDGRVSEAYVKDHRPGLEAYEATAIRLGRQRRYSKDKAGTVTLVVNVTGQQ